MAAGLGFKNFVSGDVLTAADTNGYLMQGVWVFANAAARSAAVTSPQEGNASFLKDTNALEIYDGAAWVAYGAGDITGLTAGVGISITSETGPVPTITNSSTDLITTAGDILYGTAADTVARLGIGTAGQVLTVNSGATAPEWKNASASTKSFSLLNTGGTALTGATTVTVSGITGMDDLFIIVENASAGTGANIYVRFNGVSTGSKYGQWGQSMYVDATYNAGNFYALTGTANQINFAKGSNNANYDLSGIVAVRGCNTSGIKMYQQCSGIRPASGSTHEPNVTGGYFNDSATISSVSIISTNGNLDNGTVYVYGAA